MHLLYYRSRTRRGRVLGIVVMGAPLVVGLTWQTRAGVMPASLLGQAQIALLMVTMLM